MTGALPLLVAVLGGSALVIAVLIVRIGVLAYKLIGGRHRRR